MKDKSREDAIFDDLYNKYGFLVISKKELAKEMGIGLSTLSRYIKEGMGLPPYKKLGESKNSKVVFNLRDVASFLSETVRTL